MVTLHGVPGLIPLISLVIIFGLSIFNFQHNKKTHRLLSRISGGGALILILTCYFISPPSANWGGRTHGNPMVSTVILKDDVNEMLAQDYGLTLINSDYSKSRKPAWKNSQGDRFTECSVDWSKAKDGKVVAENVWCTNADNVKIRKISAQLGGAKTAL